ncbi:unnamed protein product [Schistosoma turkestanicum]|nr:unnamed protein product [Schistosoma turkestanicum]
MPNNNNESVYQTRYNAFVKQLIHHINLTRWPFLCHCLNEFLGTTIFIIIGSGVMLQTCIGSMENKDVGQFLSISSGWGIAKITGLLISTGGGVGGDSHHHQYGLLNPALTLACCLIGKLPFRYLLPFSIFQLSGSILGTLIIIGIYWENLQIYAKIVSFGKLEMNFTGALFVTTTIPSVSHQSCFMDHILSSGLFTGLVLIIKEKHFYNIPFELQIIYIGLVTTGIIGSLSLNIGVALNPARDLGWGIQPFKANNYYFWLPLVGPYIGALIGSFFYVIVISIHVSKINNDEEIKQENDECNTTTIIDSTVNYLQSSLVEEMTADLFDINEVDDCFTTTTTSSSSSSSNSSTPTDSGDETLY